jgi:hypothetical protein
MPLTGMNEAIATNDPYDKCLFMHSRLLVDGF